MTPESLAALADLRRGGHFEWHVVNALAVVIYVYASAVRRGEWDRVALGIGFWAVEFLWEMFNALVLHFTGRAALWTVAGKSSFLIYVGLNVEISLMFAIAPIALLHLLPVDRHRRIAGVPNRLLIPVGLGVFCVAVESGLNHLGALVWTWPFWRWPNIGLIVVAYAMPFVVLAWVHDHVSARAKVRGAIATVGLAIFFHVLLAYRLGWI